MITWSRPPVGVFKINVAGFSDDSRRYSTISCVMRNITRYWLGGYYGKKPYESELLTDIHAIYYGIKLAHDEGIKHIQLECNSDVAINHIIDPQESFEGSEIIGYIRDMMRSSFHYCELITIPVSSNQLAINFSYYAINEGDPIRYLNSCPSDLVRVMAADWIASY